MSSTPKSKNKQLINLIIKKWGQRLMFNYSSRNPELDGKPLDLNTLAIQFAVEFDVDISNAKAVQMVTYIAKSNAANKDEPGLSEKL